MLSPWHSDQRTAYYGDGFRSNPDSPTGLPLLGDPTPELTGDESRELYYQTSDADVLGKVDREFHDWAYENNKQNPYDEEGSPGWHGEARGPVGYWPHVEDFLKERYPAAHRGLSLGMEEVGYLMDVAPHTHTDDPKWKKPIYPFDKKDGKYVEDLPLYETGVDAVNKYGYDPKEVVAALMLLHNDTSQVRKKKQRDGVPRFQQEDLDRLHDIAVRRYKMQQQYEEANNGQRSPREPVTARRTATAPVLDALQYEDQTRADFPEVANGPVLDKPADFPDDWFEKHWGDDDDAPLPVPEQTGPPPRPADKILNEWVNARDSITPENLSDWHAAPWTNPLEQTLYKEFQHDWWPNSEASKVRSPENVNTGWSFHPDEPITHWLNVEDFLNERYPEAATGGKYGLEHAGPMLQRKVNDQMLSPEKMKEYGYIGHGNAITQAMLNLHNKLQGRKWDRPQDQKRYYELMLRHIGPNGKKVSRLAKLIEAMAWEEPTARELVTAAHEVMRHANYLESPEGRAHLEQLMQMQQQQEKFRNGPHDNWYHVSPHDLPEGTKLVPGGVGNSATSQDFYDMGFGDDSGNLKDMGGGRTQHVWLTPDLDDAHFWSAALNAPHIYQVDPHETPSPWNGTGTDGFVSPGATIRKKVSGG